MSPPRGKRPERIGDLLREQIASLGWEGRLREEEVLAGWDAVVGPQIAEHARASHIVNRRLTVVTESPVWTQQLSLLRTDLLRRIAARFGPGTVTELFFVTGKIEPAPGDPAPREERRPVLPDLPPCLAGELNGIANTEVRASVRRVILAALADESGHPPEAGPD